MSDSLPKSKLNLITISVVTTFLSLIPTAYVAYHSNSVTLLADLLRCTAEFFAILISWLVVKQSVNIDRSKYSYGYGKLEQLSSLSVAAAMFVTFGIALTTGLYRLSNPEPLSGTELGIGLAVLSVLGNGYLWIKNFRFSSKHGSDLILSQARLFRAKTAASVSVLITLTIGTLFNDSAWAVYCDPIGSIILSLFLLYSAYQIVSNSMHDLVDRSVEERLQLLILKALVAHESLYVNLNHIKSRRSGATVFVDIYLIFDPNMLVSEMHKNIMKIEKVLSESIQNVEANIIPYSATNI